MKTRTLCILVAALSLFAACGDDDDNQNPSAPKVPEFSTGFTNADSKYDHSFEIIETPFGPLECLISDGYNSGGPSCNWEKFNQERTGAGNG